MGGELESIFEQEYQESLAKHMRMREANSPQGSALTTNSACPLCDEEWVLRHPTFGDYTSVHVAKEYFNGGMFGPHVSPYHEFDHALWLLSDVSEWLPQKIRKCLLEGLANWVSWPWGAFARAFDPGGGWVSNGVLLDQMQKHVNKGTEFRWAGRAEEDTRQRIDLAVATLSLPESAQELFERFVRYEFPQKYIAAERRIRVSKKMKAKNSFDLTSGSSALRL
jgi:hypothetical protein